MSLTSISKPSSLSFRPYHSPQSSNTAQECVMFVNSRLAIAAREPPNSQRASSCVYVAKLDWSPSIICGLISRERPRPPVQARSWTGISASHHESRRKDYLKGPLRISSIALVPGLAEDASDCGAQLRPPSTDRFRSSRLTELKPATALRSACVRALVAARCRTSRRARLTARFRQAV